MKNNEIIQEKYKDWAQGGRMMEAMLKFRGKESDVRKLISIFEAILGSEPFEDIEVVDSYECRD